MQKLNCILLVDDDPINNFINERLIRQLNVSYEIKITENGEEGLKYIKRRCETEGKACPELILLDINMPVMDGFDFLKGFTETRIDHKENAKIVILTTSTNDKDLNRLKGLGNFEYINKPLTPDKLFNCITKVISE